MAILPLYAELNALLTVPPQPLHHRLSGSLRRYLTALDQTYEPGSFGPLGAVGLLEQIAPTLGSALRPAAGYGLEETCAHWLAESARMLKAEPPDLYLGTLLFTAPAATINVDGAPAIALGLERFRTQPPAHGPKHWYHPSEAVEMVPHEAAHSVRMRALGLPPTPRHLRLVDMVMLEGTALTFADHMLGRMTLATFMPAEQLAWHQAHDAEARRVAAAEFPAGGMDVFRRYFSRDSRVSGYYVGYTLCREYLQRYGPDLVTELVTMPSDLILQRLGWQTGSAP